MPVYKRREALARLKKKGFRESSYKQHLMLVLTNEDSQETNLRIRMPNPSKGGGKSDVKDNDVSEWSNALGLNDKQFMFDFLKCDRTHQDLCGRLREEGRLQ